jgi:hypothetical protein
MIRVLVVWVAVIITQAAGASLRHPRRLVEDLLCHIQAMDIEYDSDGELDEVDYVCIVNDQVYGIVDLPGLFQVPGTTLTISKAWIDPNDAMIHIASDANLTSDSNEVRRLAPTIGVNQVLVVRVSYFDKAPTLSASQLAGRIFGTGPDAEAVSLSSQFRACSFGKLELVPADGTGVTELSINETVSGDYSVRLLENLVVEKLKVLFGDDLKQFQHIIIVMPTAELRFGGRSFLAYGFLNGIRTVFSDMWGGQLSALAHEVGHNLNLAHAGRNQEPYGGKYRFVVLCWVRRSQVWPSRRDWVHGLRCLGCWRACSMRKRTKVLVPWVARRSLLVLVRSKFAMDWGARSLCRL